MKVPLNISGLLYIKQAVPADQPQYYSIFSSCAAVHGGHTAARDSIPPKDAVWYASIDFSQPYGNKVQSTHHATLDKDDPLKALALMGGEHLEKKQVLIIRDEHSPNLIFSFVDREKEKELFGDEKERGIERVEFCIPEIFRKMTPEEVKLAKETHESKREKESFR